MVSAGGTLVLLGAIAETGLTLESGAITRHADAAVFRGQYMVSAANSFSGGTVDSGWTQDVYAGGLASGTTVSNATGIGAASQYVGSGGVARGTTLLGGGHDYVSSGAVQTVDGSAFATTLHGGVQYDYGVASFTRVLGGSQTVETGGMADATSVTGGGHQLDFGTASGTVISAGGQQAVDGGVAIGTWVGSGGAQTVGGNGIAQGTTVTMGGRETLTGSKNDRDATTTGTILSAGGTETLNDRAFASGTVISAGGDLQVATGSLTNTVLNTGGSIDLQHFAYAPGATATLNTTDLLTISAAGSSTSLQLAGSYTGETFDLGKDSASGTLITLSAATAAIAGARASGELLPSLPAAASTPWTEPAPADARGAASETAPVCDFAELLLPHPL